jgi:hypothetical protein
VLYGQGKSREIARLLLFAACVYLLLKDYLPILKKVIIDTEYVGREQGPFVRRQALASRKACDALAGLYLMDGVFRSEVEMGGHGFSHSEYKYFSYPLPDITFRSQR